MHGRYANFSRDIRRDVDKLYFNAAAPGNIATSGMMEMAMRTRIIYSYIPSSRFLPRASREARIDSLYSRAISAQLIFICYSIYNNEASSQTCEGVSLNVGLRHKYSTEFLLRFSFSLFRSLWSFCDREASVDCAIIIILLIKI